MEQKKVVTLEDRIPTLKQQRKQRANRRLVFYLSIFFLLLLSVVYFQSPLSDIKTVAIVGNYYVSDEKILKVADFQERTSFWNINAKGIETAVNSLVEVKNTHVTRKIPNKLQIEVEEYKRVGYYLHEGKYFPILETGEILDHSNSKPIDAPLLVNWQISEELEEMAVELKEVQESLIERISEIHHTPVKNDPLHLVVLMNDGFQVSTTIRDFASKIASYPAIVQQLDPNVKGVIHMKMNPYFEQFEYEEELDVESEG